ncbi:mCG51376 [Mus musculus]|nr:mCG51376 [Mus musculus]
MAAAGFAVSGARTPVVGPTGRDLFAEGLLEFLRPAMQQLDSHIHEVRESQVKLREQNDNLATELCQINEDQKVALDLDRYVKKVPSFLKGVKLLSWKLPDLHKTVSVRHCHDDRKSGGHDVVVLPSPVCIIWLLVMQ